MDLINLMKENNPPIKNLKIHSKIFHLNDLPNLFTH